MGAEAGGAAVEFAILLPVLLIILVGLIDFSLIFYNQAVVTNASREATRAGIVLKTPKMSNDEIRKVALDYCSAHLISPGGAKAPTVVVSQSSSAAFSTPLSVNVSFVYTGLFIDTFLSALTGPLTVSATTVMLNE